ncbi:hypothetical protein [Papillibacter cinnamivorans]|uniref:Uncharacterized protein n=1 Tax=Papillibacter cinnamivorans DSM 12816 TaxID=1122930 RepID=A0A1W1YQ62_9FIRM|nr:hypothetical protein [Papillibacter cinnamivorans]SMC38345.1 hypothetical protein SAMN02745168_0618 [Papillibacter cinnamivorans DSM 12816]
MNADEIVKALKWIAKVRTYCDTNMVNCTKCEFHGFCTDPDSDESIGQQSEWFTQAANLIESLTTQINTRFTAPIVCMCGSTKFKQTWIRENARLTQEGNIVLAVGLWGHHERKFPAPEVKAKLDDLHKRKIDLCDWVWVLDVGGYIGESTRSEIAYAEKLGKPIRYLAHEFPEYIEPEDEVVMELTAQLAAYKKTDLTADEIFQMRKEWRDTEKGLRDSVIQLQSQLAESRCREKAAMADLERQKICGSCAYWKNGNCTLSQQKWRKENYVGCKSWKWRGTQDSGGGYEMNTVNVRWHDGYLETFMAQEVRFGSDLLWMRLSDGQNRHIPLRSVRWFSLSKESHAKDAGEDE